jgi:hypothetical protein
MVFNEKVALVGMVPDARHCLHAGSQGYRKDPQTPRLILHGSTVHLFPCPAQIMPGMEFSRKTSADIATITKANITGFRQSPSKETHLVNNYE